MEEADLVGTKRPPIGACVSLPPREKGRKERETLQQMAEVTREGFRLKKILIEDWKKAREEKQVRGLVGLSQEILQLWGPRLAPASEPWAEEGWGPGSTHEGWGVGCKSLLDLVGVLSISVQGAERPLRLTQLVHSRAEIEARVWTSELSLHTAPRPAPWAVTLVGAGCPVPCRRSPPPGRQSVRLLSWCPHTRPDGRGRAGAGGLCTHSWRWRRHLKAARQSP